MDLKRINLNHEETAHKIGMHFERGPEWSPPPVAPPTCAFGGSVWVEAKLSALLDPAGGLAVRACQRALCKVWYDPFVLVPVSRTACLHLFD